MPVDTPNCVPPARSLSCGRPIFVAYSNLRTGFRFIAPHLESQILTTALSRRLPVDSIAIVPPRGFVQRSSFQSARRARHTSINQLLPTTLFLRRDFGKNPLSYQTPATLLLLPLAPAAFARSAHLAPLTSLRPRWGLARLLLRWSCKPKLARISLDDTRKHPLVSKEPNF